MVMVLVVSFLAVLVAVMVMVADSDGGRNGMVVTAYSIFMW